MPSGNVPVCLNGGIKLACSTEGTLLWEGDDVNEVFAMFQAPVTEGNFTLEVTSVTASRVNSTATLSNFQGEQDGLSISCVEISTGSRQMAVLRAAGELIKYFCTAYMNIHMFEYLIYSVVLNFVTS